MDDQNFKNFPPTKFDVFFTMYSKRKCSKLKKSDGSTVPRGGYRGGPGGHSPPLNLEFFLFLFSE